MHTILTINGGSSSIRFAQFSCKPSLRRVLDGKVERVESAEAAVKAMVHELEARSAARPPDAIGHRIVHGLGHQAPERVTPSLLKDLRDLTAIDPEHLPRELELIDLLSRRYPDVPQVVCFDTAFHHDMPRVAKLLPIPRKYLDRGVRRYGFHGLSYTFLLQQLNLLGETAATNGRVILAHLGSGCSLCAVRDGRCVDTSMGFTPAAGLMMGTRSGDLDPGLMGYLARTDALSVQNLQHMVNHESGLAGVSEISADVRDLLRVESSDVRARDALALFCYQAKKWIGAYAAVLGGLDALVFAGGIGENSPEMRARICEGLDFLGVRLDPARNTDKQPNTISAHNSSVRVRVIRTDEEAVVAQLTAREMQFSAVPR